LPKDVIYEKESFYNNLRVIKRWDDKYSISVNWWTSYSVSVSEKTRFLTDSYYDYFAVMPILAKGKDILILGMGAGTSVKQFEYFYPDAKIDAVEIDPLIIELGKTYHPEIPFQDPRVSVYTEDGRAFLEHATQKYDLIISELFFPWHAGVGSLYSLEHYRATANRLRPRGVFVQWIAFSQFTAAEFRVLARNDLGEPIFARYNPPFTPWFLRRNEVLIPVERPQN
jgi:spermidine synthase